MMVDYSKSLWNCIMHTSRKVEKQWASSSHLIKLDLPFFFFFGCAGDGLFHWDNCHTFSGSYVCTHGSSCDNVHSGSWVSFKPPLKILAHADNSLSGPHTAGRAQIWHQSNARSDYLSIRSRLTLDWQHKIPSVLATRQTVIILFLRTSSFTWSTFHVFWFSTDVPSNLHLKQTSHHFWTWETTQKLVFFPLPAPRTLLSTFLKFQ